VTVPSKSPTLSIVIEFENAGRIGCERAERMLSELHRQLSELAPELSACEVMFMFSADQVDGSWLEKAVSVRGDWPAALRFLRSSISGYYEQKNLGADLATGDIIVFIDSDVVPLPGWLEALIQPIRVGCADIVAGATSVERQSLYSTAMALGWIFPLPPQDLSVRPTRQFCANNVAFRRDLVGAMRFPEVDLYREQIGGVYQALSTRGSTMVMNGAAAVLHPPPEGFRGFVTRALWCGYDTSRAVGSSRVQRLARALRAYIGGARSGVTRVVRDRRRAGLGLVGAGGALAVISAYHAIRILGFAAGLVAPDRTWRQLRRIAP